MEMSQHLGDMLNDLGVNLTTTNTTTTGGISHETTRVLHDVINLTLGALGNDFMLNNKNLLHGHLYHPHTYNNINNNNNNNSSLSTISTTITSNNTFRDYDMQFGHAPTLTRSALIKVYVLSLMAGLSLLGNILTMWNIFKTRISRRNSRHSWSAIYALIFHLSIADVMVSGFCIIGEAIWYYTVQWLAEDYTCKMVKFFQMFSLYISTYVLVLIGIDRWIAVKYPMKSLNMAKRCYRLLAGIYVLSFFLSLPQIFIFHVARGPFVEEFYQCVTHGFYTADWQEQVYGAFTLFFTFIFPLIVLLITYLSTFFTISNSEKMFQSPRPTTYTAGRFSMQTNRQRLIHKAKMKSLRISVVIIFAFLICWTPYNVMMILFMFTNIDQRLGEDLQSAIFFFGMSNSLVNPVIYGAFHLCPAHKKSRNAKNTKYALNRGDSQRGSMLTGTTQLDSTLRHPRSFRQSSFCRQHSNCSVTNQKDIAGLLPMTTSSSPSSTSPTKDYKILRDANDVIKIHHNNNNNNNNINYNNKNIIKTSNQEVHKTYVFHENCTSEVNVSLTNNMDADITTSV